MPIRPIGESIKYHPEQHNLSMKALARLAGASQSGLCEVESGKFHSALNRDEGNFMANLPDEAIQNIEEFKRSHVEEVEKEWKKKKGV